MELTVRHRNRFFRSADANRALDEYEDAFGDTQGFYLRQAQVRTRAQEAEYALVIRNAISNGERMTEDQILDMYGIVYQPDVKY